MLSINPVRKRRLFTILYISLGLGLALSAMLYALNQNISLFYSPAQIVAGEAPVGRAIHVGGMVVKGSVKRLDDMKVIFELTDYQDTVTVEYTGILPDLFREEQGIVAQGELVGKHHVKADVVLAKHDENYMPKEVRDSLKEQKKVQESV